MLLTQQIRPNDRVLRGAPQLTGQCQPRVRLLSQPSNNEINRTGSCPVVRYLIGNAARERVKVPQKGAIRRISVRITVALWRGRSASVTRIRRPPTNQVHVTHVGAVAEVLAVAGKGLEK